MSSEYYCGKTHECQDMYDVDRFKLGEYRLTKTHKWSHDMNEGNLIFYMKL